LQQKKVRAETGLFVAEGVKVVTELVASSLHVKAVFSTDTYFLAALTGNFRKEAVSTKEMEAMSGLSTPSSVLAIGEIPQAIEPQGKLATMLALDGIRDPGNMGTIIRTAKWFGIEQILCSQDCVDSFNPKVVQGAMGALFHTAIHYCELAATLADMKLNGYHILTATLEGNTIYDQPITGKNILVMGNESHGVSETVLALCDQQLSIPNFEQEQRVESLNVSIATAILLSELTRKATTNG